MQVSNQIEQLIQDLEGLKPLLSEDKQANAKKFAELLEISIKGFSDNTNLKSEVITLTEQKMVDRIPHWVDPEYSYDPANPRKPNMRELMEAISGKNLEELYLEQNKDWEDISHQSSEVLYGVLGPNKDTRDWSAIMSSDNILTTATDETGKMLEPKVQILSKLDDNGEVVDQVAFLKDKNNNFLREISTDLTAAEDTLRTFGATHASVPPNLEGAVVTGKFNTDLLTFLKNFDRKITSVEHIVLETATEAITKKLSKEDYDLTKL